jgi:hypothetical protein
MRAFKLDQLQRINVLAHSRTRAAAQEVAGELGSAMAGPLLAAAPADDAAPAVSLATSRALAACLRRCVAPDAFVARLGDRFLRLALQLAARYSAWLAAAVDPEKVLAQLPACPRTSSGPTSGR